MPARSAVFQADAAAGGGDEPRAGAQEDGLPAALHARQPDGLAPADVEVERVELDAPLLGAHAGETKQVFAGGARHAFPGGHLALEHHGDEAVHLERRHGLSDEPTLAEHGHPGAELLDFLELVRHEEHGLALLGQTAEGAEELVALRGADAGGGLVEDEDAGSQPQQAQQLQLLALAHGERPDFGLEVDGQAEGAGQVGDGLGRLRPPGDEPPRGADEQVVHHAHRREVEGVLMQHAHAVTDGVGGRAQGHGLAVEQDLSAVGRLEARQDLHERALARSVLAQDSLDGAGGDREGDAVVGSHRAEMLVDVPNLYFQPYSGPAPWCRLRKNQKGETGTVSPFLDPCSDYAADSTRRRSGLPCPARSCGRYQICWSVATSPSFR